ncbi:hypothetical protein Tsubulata_041492 [Turnera subulata]|uniref:Uncharacterized protein n=1 Tax=Turnera subulata TaxID=218843 RepID=A0A9Q0JAV4_9ROSI|nr:hypothetical protein Tsubulata_041492 [Turnera subulata]
MASSTSLRSTFTSPLSLPSPTQHHFHRKSRATFAPVRCGNSRSNRGPLVRGRILSTEAILAIQSLKRAASRTNTTSPPPPPPNLTRLLKRDLLAVLRELLRQDQCTLGLQVLYTLRSEYPPGGDEQDRDAFLALYADVINCLSRNAMFDRVEGLLDELETAIREMSAAPPREGLRGGGEKKGLEKVVRAVVEAGRRDLTVGIVGVLRRCGCGDTWTADEYLVQVLVKGLKGIGEVEMASRVAIEFGEDVEVNFEKLPV